MDWRIAPNWRFLAVWLPVLALAACGSLPARPPVDAAQEAAQATIDTSGTRLAAIARASLDASQPSGFRLLPQAGQAFEAREQLIARAGKTLDAQYYYVSDDASGRAFLRDLMDAAARGVRVRLLVDDLYTTEIDATLAQMAAMPNLQVRVFNPFCCARRSLATRFAASLLDVRRLNGRMHNKLLVADRALAIAGGRNIADEYFARSAAHEFVDIDAIMAGDIVAQLDSVFTRYWESNAVWPVQSFSGAPPGDSSLLAASAPATADEAGGPRDFPPVDVLGQPPVGEELARGRLTLVPGAVYAFADPPAKVLGGDSDYLHDASVTSRARGTMAAAQSEVVVSSPYLIPRELGIELIHNLGVQGVKMKILTNGRSANDNFFAYAGYSRYRRQMLAEGVDLYELNATGKGAGERAGAGLRRSASAGRLHAKAIVIDRTTVFVGSMNLDPRSADQNTELGILVESPPLAQQMLEVIDANRRLGSYQVRLGAGTPPALEWVLTGDGGDPQVLTKEPDFGLWQWLQEKLVFPLGA